MPLQVLCSGSMVRFRAVPINDFLIRNIGNSNVQKAPPFNFIPLWPLQHSSRVEAVKVESQEAMEALSSLSVLTLESLGLFEQVAIGLTVGCLTLAFLSRYPGSMT